MQETDSSKKMFIGGDLNFDRGELVKGVRVHRGHSYGEENESGNRILVLR